MSRYIIEKPSHLQFNVEELFKYLLKKHAFLPGSSLNLKGCSE